LGVKNVKKLFKNEKGVSPVISTVLMILVVMVGMSLLFAFLATYTMNFHSGSGSSVLESMTIEDAWFKNSDNTFHLWVYNVGKVDFMINSIYVNGTKVTPTMSDSNNNPINSNTPIQINKHVQISLAQWQLGDNYNLKIVTGRGSAFEGNYAPPN
jgi:flagellin-like protein